MTNLRPSAGFGIAFMIAGMFCISLNDMLIKQIADRYPLHQILFWRSMVGALLMLGAMWLEGGFRLLRSPQPGLHVLRASLLVLANCFFFAGIVALPLATATALYFVAPLFVTLLSIPVLGERVGPRRIGAVLVGFCGVLLMMSGQLSGGAGWAALLPVISAAGYAGMSVLTRKLGQRSAASSMALYAQSAFVLFALGFYAVAGDGRFAQSGGDPSLYFLFRPWVEVAPGDIWILLCLGVLAGLIGYTLAQAYRLAQASTVAPFEYVLLIFATLWGWLVFQEWPRPSVFAGAGIIIASGLYIVFRERHRVP